MAILSRQSHNLGATENRIKYVDGFAGPGVYEKGEKGSPVLALEAALNHNVSFPVPVELIFIENDIERFGILKAQLTKYADQVARSTNVRAVKPIHGDCRVVLDQMLDAADKRTNKFGPALVFLDQFGYSAVPMELIGRVLSHGQCEVLTYLFWRDLDRFITDPHKHQGISTAFGCGDWEPAISLPAGQRERFMLRTYMQSLRNRARAEYVWPFAMLDQNERLLYWLFFCTNNIRGLYQMKRAMWKVDQTGGFTFNDKDGFGQLKFLTAYTDEQLAKDMERELAGRTMRVGEVEVWVLAHTPAYKFKAPLAAMERRGTVKAMNPPPSRHGGKFPDDDMLVQFALPALFNF